MSEVFFTADLHFGHKSIIGYTNRPVTDVAEMRAWIIDRWNTTVRPNDEVWVLGDFSFERPAEMADTFARLHGRKHLIVGNHDGDRVRRLPWMSVDKLKTWRSDGQRMVLCHYPLLTWANAHKGVWHLHGHSHGNLQIGSTRLDVGWDSHQRYAPWGLADVEDVLGDRSYVPVDHHRH